MSDVETVGLNLAGNFADEAAKSAGAADQLEKNLAKLGKSGGPSTAWVKTLEGGLAASSKRVAEIESRMEKLRAAAKKAASAGSFGEGWMNQTPSALKGPPPAFSAFQKMIGSVGDVFGPKAAGGLVKGASSLVQAGETLGPVAPALMSAGGALVAAAGALAAATAALLGAGMKFSIEKSSEKEIQKSVFGALGNSGGFEMALNLAAKFNLDEGKAIDMVKSLMQSKLGNADIEVWTKIAVGVGAVKGEGKASALLEKLSATLAKGGKASEESIKGFAEAGINVDTVWAKLAAKLGVSVDKAKSMVKAGSVDMKTAMDAVKVAAEQDFGAVADKMGGSVPGLLNALKISFGQLFADVDLGPLKEMLGGLLDVLKGDAGGALKSAITELFGNLGEALFGAFKGEQGKAKMAAFIKDVTAGIKDLSAVIKELTPAFHAVGSAVLMVAGKAPGFIASWLGVIDTISPVIEVLASLAGAFFTVQGAVGSLIGSVFAPFQFFYDLITGGADKATAGGNSIGSNLVSGMINGITSGASGVIQSAIDTVLGAVGAANSAADAHSPSRKMAKLGGFMSEGLAVGMSSNDNASAAAANSVNAAMGAAAGAAGGAQGAGAKAGAGGGGPSITINIGAGAKVDASQLKAIEEAAYEGHMRAQRAMGREAREGSKAA